jgi:peptidoglycan/LPS O-acetylase OafA/YrhL
VSSVNKPAPKERVYYADWVRSLSITLVIFVHALCNSFDASGLNPDEVFTI